MSLRLRLIVAFFLFSVVPLAAVTFYSYTGNLRALHVAAQHETEMLTGELTQRMQVVTTQISERVEDLMDMPAAVSTAATGTSGKGRSSNTTARRARVVARTTPAPAARRLLLPHRRRLRRRPCPPSQRRSIRAPSKGRSRRRSARSRCC